VALATRISLQVLAELTSSTDLAPLSAPLNFLREIVLTSGTGLGQADRIFADRRTVNASATDTIDLTGSLTDIAGAAFAPAKLKAIILHNPGPQTLELTRPADTGVPFLKTAGDAIPVPAGSTFHLATAAAAGLATVTAGTGDEITIVNGAGNAVVYDLVLIGTSA
jgi:hypothetical protein